MNIKAIALGAVITLSACGGAQAASITTAATPTTTKAITTTVAQRRHRRTNDHHRHADPGRSNDHGCCFERHVSR